MQSTDSDAMDHDLAARLAAALGGGPKVKAARQVDDARGRRLEIGTIPLDAVLELARRHGIDATGPNAVKAGYKLCVADDAGNLWFLATPGL